MDRLIEAVIALLRTEGIYAVRAFPQGAMPALKAPCTAVGLSRAKGAGRAVYTYLGMEENADGTQTPLYGRALETEIFLQVFCPRGLGAQRCMEEAERVTFFVTALLSAVCMLIWEKPSWSAVVSCLIPILYSGVCSGGAGYTLQILGQQYAAPAVASLLLSLESVFAALFGWLLLAQGMSARELIGCALMFAAILLAQYAPQKPAAKK